MAMQRLFQPHPFHMHKITKITHCIQSFRSIHLQRSNAFCPKHTKLHQTSQSNKFIFQHKNRYIWIPPVWLRPLIRPLIVIVGSFIGGIILQMYKGQPPQWLLTAESAETSTAATHSFSRYTGKIFGGSALCIILYLTRLRNPLYISLIGSCEANLALADDQANTPWNAKWDTRSANDSMATRLSAMERYLGEAMSSAQSDQMSAVQTKVSKIRKKGYTNAIIIALNRADFWADSGEIKKFEQTMKKLNKYQVQGGDVNIAELEKVKGKAYGIHCGKLLAEAQTFSNQGDVSQCQKRLGEIKSIQYKLNGTFVEKKKLQEVEDRAHQHHVLQMIDEARIMRRMGSRKVAKDKLQHARQYADLHCVEFDKSLAQEIESLS